ncbi:MAG: fasciclin domain-containing protein [Bacteroidaceae bacterium]|nr:fasciclin domain-containing protein [Bacteroidaceae bacterium]
MMKKPLFTLLIVAVLLCLIACSESIDTSSKYVFKEHTIASYLESHADYSQYVELLKQVQVSRRSQTTMYQLLTARGNYTVFAPTNAAIERYLQKLAAEEIIPYPSWEAVTDSIRLDSLRKVIVHNSVIDGGDLSEQVFYTAKFPDIDNGELSLPNMLDHKINVTKKNAKNDTIYLNGDCPMDIRNLDIPVINGVIHQMHKVIAPDDVTAARYFRLLMENEQEGYLVMAKCLEACGMFDTLSALRDEVYETLYQTGKIPDLPAYMSHGFSDASGNSASNALAPEHRKYGFTIFAEPDSYWRSQGIDPHAPNVPELMQKWVLDNGMYLSDDVYTTDADYHNPNNVLNQWTTYHVLPMRIEANKLVYHWNETGYSRSTKKLSIPVMEWYATMGKRRLIKIFESLESQGVFLNRFPNINRERTGDGHENSCDQDKRGCLVQKESEDAVVSDMVNAVIYPIDAPLAYNNATRNNLGRERLRFDCFSLFPESMTNGIRRADSAQDKFNHVYIPADKYYRYFNNMSIMSDDTDFIHFNGYNVSWENYDGDEDKWLGRYDVMFTLPPVPKRSTYELRYKVLATAARGVVQMYVGSDPGNLPVAGIPVDLTKSVQDLWGQSATIADTEDQDYNAEIDKKMRNNGFMKASQSVASNSYKWERGNIICSRRIIWRGTMDPNLTYYVRFKSVLDNAKKELYMDYIELCPKEVYDNPEEPEDLW